MNRIEVRRVTRDDPDTHKPGLVTIDGIEVRIRRNYGVATPRYLWDVVHEGRVVETFASAPSGADCRDAIARSRARVPHEEVVARVIAKVKAEGKRMSGRSGADRILSALAGHPAGRALTWVELNAALPSMSAGDMTVRLEELERSGLIQKDLQAGIRGRPWGWSLTDAGRARVGAPTAKASPKPAGTVADLVQEIKAEQDAGFHEKVMAARDAAASRLSLTLHDDGMLEIEVPSTGFSMLLTPSQTSQLGRFLKGTAGVWECPF